MSSCPDGERHFREAQKAEEQLRQQLAIINKAMTEAAAAAGRMDIPALAAASAWSSNHSIEVIFCIGSPPLKFTA